MTVIFEKTYQDDFETLRQYTKDFNAWVFADREARTALQFEMERKGVKAKIYSAYKPLVEFFMCSEVDWINTESIRVGVPQHPLDPDSKRFFLECYPLAGLYPHIELYQTHQLDSTYYVEWASTGGTTSTATVFAPNYVHQDHVNEQLCSPTAWVQVLDGSHDERIKSAYERLFWQSMSAIMVYPFEEQEPLFQELHIDVSLPISDDILPFYDEAISLREALHEEFYFSLLEWVQKRSGKPSGSRDIRPGQIIPNIRFGSEFSIKVSLKPFRTFSTEPENDDSMADLELCESTLTLQQVHSALNSLIQTHGGESFKGKSLLNQTIRGAVFMSDKNKRGALITGAQHANETTGVVGGLRGLNEYLAGDAEFSTAIIPVHNVDGYQLYHELLSDNPTHMHHAARYSAHGNDVEYQEPEELCERAMRDLGLKHVDAFLHLNLHGYPAHEWTRPLTGYIPKNFDLWSLPKGFFLIMRFLPGYGEQARQLIEVVTHSLDDVEALMPYNQQQLECYQRHNLTKQFDVVNGVPVMFSENDELKCPLTLITEFPDESIQGQRFKLGHDAQKVVVVSALKYLHELNQS
ncbi:M14 family zinc carboxypeptidase [Vibrio splendidus]